MWDVTYTTNQLRNFVNKYYQFVEGVAQYQQDIDELLGKVWKCLAITNSPTHILFEAVDRLLIAHVSTRIAERLPAVSGLSQIALAVSNIEHFEIACAELERKVTSIR